MGVHVGLEVAALGEHLVADLALVPLVLLAGVQPHVGGQSGPRAQHLTAVVAHEVLRGAVRKPDDVGQLALKRINNIIMINTVFKLALLNFKM